MDRIQHIQELRKSLEPSYDDPMEVTLRKQIENLWGVIECDVNEEYREKAREWFLIKNYEESQSFLETEHIDDDGKNELMQIKFITLLQEFYVEIFCPLSRALLKINERIEEENLLHPNPEMSGACEYNLLTIEQCFEYLTNRLSNESVNKWVCRLDCPTYVKSDLIDSVMKHDFTKFQSTIRDNNVDYTPISNACSQVFGLSILNDNLANAIFKNEEETSVTEESPFNEEELKAVYRQKLDAIKDGALSRGCTNEEVSSIVENLRGLYDEIIRNCLNDRPIEAMLLETVFDSYFLFSGFKAHSTNMLEEEKIVIDKFITERMNQNLFISYFLNSCFEGNIFEDDLNIILDDSEQNITNFIEHSALEYAVNQPLLSYESATPETPIKDIPEPQIGVPASLSCHPCEPSAQGNSATIMQGPQKGQKAQDPNKQKFKSYIMLKDEDKDEFIESLRKHFEDSKKGAECICIIVAAIETGKISKDFSGTRDCYNDIDAIFPGKFRGYKNFNKYMSEYNNPNNKRKDVLRWIEVFK